MTRDITGYRSTPLGNGLVIDRFGDGDDHVFADIMVGMGIGNKDCQRKPLAVGEGDEPDGIGRGEDAPLLTRTEQGTVNSEQLAVRSRSPAG